MKMLKVQKVSLCSDFYSLGGRIFSLLLAIFKRDLERGLKVRPPRNLYLVNTFKEQMGTD